MEICRLLNPAKKTGERLGKDRVEKSCPSCTVKNHIRTTYCKNCNHKLRSRPNPAAGRIIRTSVAARAAAARQRGAGHSAKAASANLAAAVSASESPGYPWPRKDKRFASGKIAANVLLDPTDFSRPRNFKAGFSSLYSGKKKTQGEKRDVLRNFRGHPDPRAVGVDLSLQ